MRHFFTPALYCFCSIILLFTGCTRNRVQEQTVVDLQKEIISLHKYHLNTNRRIEELNENHLKINVIIEEMSQDLAEVKERLKQSTQVVKKLEGPHSSTADFDSKGTERADRITESEIRENLEESGGIEPLQNRTAVKRAVDMTNKKDLILDPRQLYLKAFDRFTTGDYDQAIMNFREFVKIYPDHEYADNSYYWIGEIYYSEKKFSQAIIEFRKVIEKYPTGNKVPDAMLKLGLTYINLKDFENAGYYFQLVMDTYPFSDAAKKAGLRMKQLD